jgi:hypothetical protein
MDWHDTPQSSNIGRFAYDEESQELVVEFKNGTSYVYFDVPHRVFSEWCTASSVGQYFSQHIRGTFRYAKH